ncbi:hypothetical protein T484DRAFT_1769046, partial [Baffinella frigidus]
LVAFVKEHKASLQQTLASLRKSGTAVGYTEKIRLPRYARVNTLRSNITTVLNHFREQGWSVADCPDDLPGEGANRLCPGKNTILQDQMVPHLLAFPPGTSLHSDPLVASGAVILQDRSSHAVPSPPGAALCPIPAGAIVADACAAPGNKTTHITALLALADKEAARAKEGDGHGNKTTHITALLALADKEAARAKEGACPHDPRGDTPDKKRKEKGRAEGIEGGGAVLAFERDRVREQVLRRQVLPDPAL